MKKRTIALGFYQELSTAKMVVAELKRRNFSRFATIHHKQNQIEINSGGIDPEVVARFKNLVIADEILVVVQVDQANVREVLAILRQVKSGHPFTFLLRPAMFEEGSAEIPTEPVTMEVLYQEAAKLAPSLQQTSDDHGYSLILLQRFKDSVHTLKALEHDIADAEYIEQTMPSSAEWLLDNMYVLQGCIEDVKLNLPKKFYKELPKVAEGPCAELPRIYALATELVKNSAGRLSRENITHFLEGYQTIYPLTIGELWAFPLMLRIRLIEWVEYLAINVDNRMREGELASFWGNRLLYAARHEPGRLGEFLAELSSEHLTLSGHFAEELLDHLFDEEIVLPMVKKWLGDRFKAPLEDILHQEHINETSEQIVFSNSIKSLIALSQLSWPDIFETVSHVDAILRKDPIGVFSKMDYLTRNCYREALEGVARRVNMPEVEVAEKTLSLAQVGVKEYERHIGYYLVDDGRAMLEQAVGYSPPFSLRIRRWITNHPAGVFLGGVLLMTLAVEAFIFSLLGGFEIFHTVLLALALIPATEISVQCVNILLTMLLPTPLRPKMLFKEGIPQDYRTLVVIPMMLLTPDLIREEIDRLEIRYLANADPQLCFSLFSDFTDAPEQHLENDSELLAVAMEGLQTLENKYGADRFFLFHRQRVWSDSENAWIGWERKRGKLEYLNRFLMEEDLPENIVYMGQADVLKGIRFVITLDSDTQLPKDQAKALVEVLAHPLNTPYQSADGKSVDRGYTIIQPRVGTDFISSKASLFSKIFSEPAAVDPYTQAVSNVYQDLVGEGSYLGKGIYDVRIFYSLLNHHFPENHLLSHDLIEGAFVRVGFVSNVCLYDTHPKEYLPWIKRQHRWIRGDWQIIDWLFPQVPTGQGKKEANLLSGINRWKIFDNLRRSLLPITLMFLLMIAWLCSSKPEVATGLVLAVLLLPSISLSITKIFSCSIAALKSFLPELQLAITRFFITTVLLPFDVFNSLDAIGRVAFRRLFSHRHLLQWTVSDHPGDDQAKARHRLLVQLGGVSAFAVVVLVSVLFFNPIAMLVALPFCCLWFVAPVVVYILDKPSGARMTEKLPDADQEVLREIAHKTWRYFDELVGPQTHWLPPDNYQTSLNMEIAQRTSPTNIGMWLMALMSAYDFKFITYDILIDRAFATMHELKKLERHEGHFLNWYNIQTLDPLYPRYVSTVDSGNLLACLWTLKEGLLEIVSSEQELAEEKLSQIGELIKEIDRFSQEMNLKFLYNSDRKLFAIGYNVDDHRLDSSYYDLLASEARIASLVAIAKEDVPLEHWWALGRSYSTVQGRKVLLSWGGTMFEYLMPLIFNKQYPDSLIGEACDAAVACQITYGKQRGIPWGISESAFSAIDSHKIYQYRSFGIPGLGLKRGLEDDLVVSPYSSALALAVDAKSAVKNLKRMAESTAVNLMGSYGYYDAIDFTRQRSPTGERGVVVHVYMAHHQGMILAAINNTLNDDALIRRFHKDPRICGINSLLYERIPLTPPLKAPNTKKEASQRRLEPFSVLPIMGVVETPESATPKINLLSNENYSLMITNTGGGYGRWRDLDIYRWRSDSTRDPWGSFCYIKDTKSGELWSAAYQPTQNSSKDYSVNFKVDKAEFRRKDHHIETLTEVVVSPEDNAEIRLITLINHSSETRYLELTSYLELVLAPHLADRNHPCFNKLFIETEAVPESSALLAFRRLRSPNDLPVWAVHVLSLSSVSHGEVQYETDRSLFIGRGNSLKHPCAFDGDLSNSVGTVLDPIFSLRRRTIIKPGGRVQFSFVTAVTDNRTSAMALIEKYKDMTASHRAIELAWAFAQLELRHLRIHQEEVQLYQKLASRILYPHFQLRSAEDRLRKNRLGQSGLWPQGISGDLPIVVVTIGDIYDVDLVKQLLVAHAFWATRGLKVDLVIFNEEAAGYSQPLQEHLQSLIQAYAYRNQIDKPGGVYLRGTSYIPAEELNLILSVARAVLIAARGSLRQQLVSPRPKIKYPPKLHISDRTPEEPSRPLSFLELPYFNGLGGYTPDGRSYVIYLGPGTTTPAPWCNVLANPQFGTLISEAGVGCTWYGNSQTNRLTPWSNDPLLDPISDAIYIRDEARGVVWTPTPAPIRELDAYRITHSQGFTAFEHNSHGIDQELTIFVPVDDQGGLPLRIQRLRLSNHSPYRRRLTLIAYSEWVLGGDKEDTQVNVITEWDSESQALLAYNHYNADFGNHVAFSCALSPIASYSGDRTEFIGRNRSSSSPEALTRKSLSGHTGAALDPCSALQVAIEIDPENNADIVFVMGYAPDVATARLLIAQCRTPGKIDQLFADTKSWWDKTLETIQIDVPDQATNFFVNRWLVYQDLCCRFWGRSGFYQSSGAYGFRDQLQDVMALVYSLPNLAREYILKAASRQFIEGDVQHWWHPQTGAGARTRCSDDLLWLPFVTAHYVRVTGDASILAEKVPFLEGEILGVDQEEVVQVPSISQISESLLEHCRRAIKKGTTSGSHGLPLMGGGDWNDGMNRVGIHGKGESVWLAWFLIHVMNDFADLLCISSGDKESGEGYRIEAKRLAEVIESVAWDGAWYRRAYFDDGTPLGSKENSEAFIDSLTQSWAVITGAANPERSAMALNSAEEYLVKARDNLVLLLTPPFDKTTSDPGYIKGYPPGVRENGGQYTHGSSWLAMAFARSGNGNRAVDLLKMVSPTVHTQTTEANAHYKVEPYVLAGDVSYFKEAEGRGGWTWYTGSAGVVYRIWLEEVLGFKLRGNTLSFKCAIPKEWDSFKINYRHKSSYYEITVENPHHKNGGSYAVRLDDVALSSSEIPLVDDGGHHVVNVVIE